MANLEIIVLGLCLLALSSLHIGDCYRFEVSHFTKCMGENLDEKTIVVLTYEVVTHDEHSNHTPGVAVKVSIHCYR